MLTFYDMVIYFSLFSFAGWVVETIFCSIKDKKFAYRGFLNGPVCPIYGFGGLIVVYLLSPFQDHVFLLFFAGMIATSALEYFTHYLLETLFHAKWWDYSHLPFNINGRIALQMSIGFGLLSVVAVEFIYPPFQHLVDKIPQRHRPWLAWTLLAIFAVDLAVTVWALLRMNGALAEVDKEVKALLHKLESLDEQGASIREKLLVLREEGMSLREVKDSILENYGSAEEPELVAGVISVAQNIDDTADRVEAVADKKGFHRFQLKRITQAFPRMESTKYKETFQRLKERVTKKRK